MWAHLAGAIMDAMFSDHVLRSISRSRVDDVERERTERHIGASSLEAAPLTIRHASAADLPALGRLAALDSRRVPNGELFVGEVDGRLLAALSIDTGAVIADPFEHTAPLVELLRVHAGEVPAAPASRRLAQATAAS
jgi:hypothetical protein